MSEFRSPREPVPQKLIEFSLAIINGKKPVEMVRSGQAMIDAITPLMVIALVDELVGLNMPFPQLKTGINKLLNLFHETLNGLPEIDVPEKSLPYYLIRNNAEMDKRLKAMRPLIRKINQNKNDLKTKEALLKGFLTLEVFERHYVIKENVLFPILENQWPDYRCLQVMWSFHDDIRRNMKRIVKVLKKVDLDLTQFNKLAGELFFNMYAIKFREEKILFPVMMQTIPKRELNKMMANCHDERFPFVQPEFKTVHVAKTAQKSNAELNLETGRLTLKQIKLLFNHLPVDITFVDENNKVKYFSTPKERIFPRSKGIINRDVKNCHPPESVHVVEEIIEEFRKGNRDKASFWIRMGEVYVLIQYFAVRDSRNIYRGVVEVSQEISEIRQIEGEQRLLDWEK